MLNLAPNITDGNFTLTSMNRMFAQLGINEFVCEDEYGEVFDSSLPCDEIPCLGQCTTCGELNICEDEHVCEDEECVTCGEYYQKGDFHTCTPSICPICSGEYHPLKNDHICSNGGSGNENTPGNGEENTGQEENNNPNKGQDEIIIIIPPYINGGDTGDDDSDNYEDTPCKRVENINNNLQLRDSIKKYTNELMQGIQIEKGWIKDENGNMYYATGTSSNLTYSREDMEQLGDKHIYERFHTHPAANPIPSITDLQTMANSYLKGNINPGTFNYGILCAYYMTVYHITSENDFKSFCDKLSTEAQSVSNAYNRIIGNDDSTTKEELITKFISFIDSLDIGLKVSFGVHEYENYTSNIDTVKSVAEIKPVLTGDEDTNLLYDDCK